MVLFAPFTFLATLWLLLIKKLGTGKINYFIFSELGIFPIMDNYYEPLVNPRKHLTNFLWKERPLVGIDLNIKEQLSILEKFNFQDELLSFPTEKNDILQYYYNNGLYEAGDSEYLYSFVRLIKPKRIIEIGSGNSTLMARNAIRKNILDLDNYSCEHICIEPYEMPWLKDVGVELIREKVENVDLKFFQKLEENDILFIDSSHIIRSQGDVLYEILEILPSLKIGVYIHIHDVFTPRDYPNHWLLDEHLLWNEQYLLEAFLSNNSDFKIIGALNYLRNNFADTFMEKFPISALNNKIQPGACWLQRVN
jgi:predicted O-methyltransferase YrrM